MHGATIRFIIQMSFLLQGFDSLRQAAADQTLGNGRKTKVKVIPGQACTGPESSKRLRL